MKCFCITLVAAAALTVWSSLMNGEAYTIRLRDGSTHLEGRVEVFNDAYNAWGTVCDDGWDINDASVACRQLGLGSAVSAESSAYFGQGSGYIFMDDLDCSGYESELRFCAFTTNHNCDHTEDAGVVCSGNVTTAYAIRLRDGSTPLEGRVEVFNDAYNAWGTVCDDGWDINEASVACRQLGLGSAVSAESSAYFGQGSGYIFMDDLECLGYESELRFCAFTTNHNCGHNEDAGVVCSGNVTTAYAIRLRDGSTPLEGRVEVFNDAYNAWGTVCDDGWDINDASVACRQLGLGSAVSAESSAYFGQGSGYIFMDDLGCSGYESELRFCSFTTNHNCGHSEDAGVVCSGNDENGEGSDEIAFRTWDDCDIFLYGRRENTYSNEDANKVITGTIKITAVDAVVYSLRLVGGSSDTEGRVEVLVNGEWGTVCDNGWDFSDAEVACQQLNLGLAYSAHGSARFGEGSGAILMDDVDCAGNELQLYSCPFTQDHDCDHGKDAGVVCSGELRFGTLRLVGDSQYEGRVEVYHNGEWGTVCDDGWDEEDAEVVCNELGFYGAGSAPGGAYYGSGTGPISLSRVQCQGGESRLTDCAHDRWSSYGCTHERDAGVKCNQEEQGSNTTWYIIGGCGGFLIILFGHVKAKKNKQASVASNPPGSATSQQPPPAPALSRAPPPQTISASLPTFEQATANDTQARQTAYATISSGQSSGDLYSVADLPPSPPPLFVASSDEQLPPPPSYEDVMAGKFATYRDVHPNSPIH